MYENNCNFTNYLVFVALQTVNAHLLNCECTFSKTAVKK